MPKVYRENFLSGDTGISNAASPIADNLNIPQIIPQKTGISKIK